MIEPTTDRGLRPSELVRHHLALVVSAVMLVTVVLKLVMVAHGSQETIAALLQTAGTVNVALAALLAATTNLGLLLAVWAIPHFGEAVREKDPLLVPAVALVASFVIVALLAPWWQAALAVGYLAAMLLAGVPFMLYDRVRRKRRTPREAPRRWEATVAVAIGAVTLWLIVLASDQPWLPAQRLTLASGEPIVGFVVAEEEDSITVMRDSDRVVVRIPSREVSDRAYCTLDDRDPRPLPVLLLSRERPEYPKCW